MLLHVSAFSIGHRQAVRCIKREYLYRELLLVSETVAFSVYVIKMFLCSMGENTKYLLKCYGITGWFLSRGNIFLFSETSGLALGSTKREADIRIYCRCEQRAALYLHPSIRLYSVQRDSFTCTSLCHLNLKR